MPKISKPDHDAAIRVLVGSKSVVNWVKGLAKSYGVDLNTPAGKTFFERESKREAERLTKQAR